MLDIQHSELDQQNVTSYKNYPVDKPFINTKWVRPSRTLSKAYPESNRDSRLEIDQAINKNDENEEAINDKRSNETEIRILKLEEQLEKMRQMVNENENENNRIARANSNKRLINLENDENERLIINKKTQDLEKKQINRTDSKHRIVEQTENMPIKKQKGKSKEAQKMKKKINRKQKRSLSIDSTCCLKTEKHYRLNLGDIPFVVGKSITPSYHLGSNIQNVISLLKLHHPKLCNSMGHHKKNDMNVIMNTKAIRGDEKKIDKSKRYKRASSVPLRNNYIEYDMNSVDLNSHSNRSTSPSASLVSNKENKNVKNDWPIYEYLNEASSKELLRHLQAEYTQLVLEHYEVTKRILNCVDENVRDEYELKAKDLDLRMRKKANHINRLKNYNRKNFTKNSKPNSKKSQSLHNVTPKSHRKKLKSNKIPQAISSVDNNNNNFVSKSMNNNDFFVKYSNLYPSSSGSNNNNIYQNNGDEKNHYKSLKLFKDIRNLKNRIENDQ